jgi:hypothetical protein
MVQCATLIFAAQLLKDPSIKFGLYASCEIDRCSNYFLIIPDIIQLTYTTRGASCAICGVQNTGPHIGQAFCTNRIAVNARSIAAFVKCKSFPKATFKTTGYAFCPHFIILRGFWLLLTNNDAKSPKSINRFEYICLLYCQELDL